MSDAQREILESLAKSQTAAHREVTRAKALLLAADGLASTAVAYEVGVSPSSVVAWRSRFAEEGLAKLGRVRPGRGRKPQIPAEKIDEIVRLTQESKPEGETHWSCRSMAKAAGVSPATVQRVWSARGLKPHLVRTFKLSNDRRFDEKLIDVIGVYLNPPDKAVVLCMDEKSQIQALDRKSVPDLIAAIEAYLQANNNDPKPFVWTATAEEILEKVSRGRVALASMPANNAPDE
jgi:transcriptional regulator with XRE-family HTH domain